MTAPTRFRGAYAGNWPEVATAVKADAGERCVRCGHPNGDTQRRRTAFDEPGESAVKSLVPCDDRCSHEQDGKMRVLTVHHLDGDKANNRWWNLLALCQVCHLQVQAAVIPERPYMLPHTPWFRVYVAGFYAWYYGGVEVDRADAEANTDRYLAMGQPWLYAERAS